MELIVKTLMGLEGVLEKEIHDLGYEKTEPLTRGVRVFVDTELAIYRLNYHLRTALKVLKVIHRGTVRSNQELYDQTRRINWYEIFELTQTFAIDSLAFSEEFNNSMYVSLVVKDGIVDQFRDKYRRRPDVSKRDPDILINVHISGEDLTISLDSSGEPLFKRGYKKQTAQAPINEVLAAGMILLSDWDKKTNFIDPMCGSGTIPIEAIMIATNTPPQLKRRKYAFMNWQSFRPAEWLKVKRDWDGEESLGDTKIYGFDHDDLAVKMAQRNFDNLDLDNRIQFMEKDFFQLDAPGQGPCFIITNPPYDMRLEQEEVDAFYKKMGDQFKQKFTGGVAWIISGNIEAIKHVGLKTSRKIHLMNGAIESKFHKFEMY